MPQHFISQTRLGLAALRQSEDRAVDELFLGCLEAGAPMLRALASRAYVDLNREPYELDARMFKEALPGYMNPGSPRVAAGFGTVPRQVGEGVEIYRSRIPLSEAMARIETFYKPYHRTLAQLLQQVQNAEGMALLVDCHSMPCSAAKVGGANAHTADIVLGDRFGLACSAAIAGWIENFFAAQGLRTIRNRPYAGGFITESYGAPHHNSHAIQVEINRSLYMNETTSELTAHFKQLRALLDTFAVELAAFVNELNFSNNFKQAAE